MLDLETVNEKPWERQRLQVPRDDGFLFVRPSLSEAVKLLRSNHAFLETAQTDIQGRTLEHLRRWSRDLVLEAARKYTSELTGEEYDAQAFEFVIVGGHQPSLFHPGVWVKNFAIGELAARTGGVALNLVIDNDALSTSRIRIPSGNRNQPMHETIPFDDERPSQPWEEIAVQNRELFQSFGDRVARQMQQWNITPLAAEIWPDAVNQLKQSDSLRDCLTAARHRLERRWGLTNFELPISRLCTLDPFLWFTSHLLAHLPRFHRLYNEVLQEYRKVNRIRSQSHPVPELKENDDWLEAPFWVWRTGDHKRGHLFAKQLDREVHLSDGTRVFAKLPLNPDMEACCAMESLRELSSQGIHLRTRALTTTLFTRLCLSDLFVHGIGGAKYDEMTNRIISRFFKLPAPEFLTLSATLLLPLAEPFSVKRNEESRLCNLLRDLQYNSDRHLSDYNAQAQKLIDEKQRLIHEQHVALTTGLSHRERQLKARSNHERFRRFQQVDRELAKFTPDQRHTAEKELDTVRHQLAANTILQDREFSFCLYPEEKLRPFMTGLKG